MPLKEYKAKRNFARTKEPAGKAHSRARRREPMFVIQKHAATRLHYDFRLEMDGVLKSWAVPKGLPTMRGEKRLAVHVEDHPIEYADFEGTIPRGNYGAGTVMVWDFGTYEPQVPNPIQAIKNGKLHFTLAGKKLKGEWALVRMRDRGEAKEQWLIFKAGEDARPLSKKAENHSAATERTMDQIAAENNRQWKSNRSSDDRENQQEEAKAAAKSSRKTPARRRGRKSKPAFIEPMKCLLVESLPKGPEWSYEIKFDGYRAIAIKDGGEVSLISRNQKDFTSRYGEIADSLGKLAPGSLVMDGEIVALNPDGSSSFQLLQSCYLSHGPKPPLFYYAFDLLHLEGSDLAGIPLEQRKDLLRQALEDAPPNIVFSASIEAEGERVLKAMKARGLEGMIAKQRDSLYEPGRRSGKWLKFKWTNEQEFVIGGYTPPEGSRSHFGAILAGYYERGKLMYASKVGSGFDSKSLASLHECFQRYRQKECPFANLPEKTPGRWGQGMTAAKMRHCVWLKPELVCQIRFGEWTRDRHLRQPVFLGLREDKEAFEVKREMPGKRKARWS